LTPEDIRDLNEAGISTWICEKCGAVVHDISDTCPICLPEPMESGEHAYYSGEFKPGCFADVENRAQLRHHDLVKRVIALGLYDELGLHEDHIDDDEGREEDLEKIAYAYEIGDDGFDVAKILDDDGITMTAAKVAIIDEFNAHDIVERAERRWVIDRGIAIKYQVGDIVKFRYTGTNACTGTITKIYAETADYVIYNEKLCGPRGPGVTCTGVVIHAEDVVEKV